ncbi:restriction endonuclease [Commensalibacter oyaizuii]|uniref:Restriction endonuclease n=1 Tax=Commensalibacter oyaizuii TaxID=3043873 RepID=A0ABT6Q118_9PROT|nr:restriction endonuclease [Commensalibacter sp. TBRC 16381]MDI2090788.1 restriction endonuclease [Commensalibacter sp. TBRC 16381]
MDGSLTHEGTTYLLELKFTKNQSGAPEIDSLKAKVNKMADNTMGIMISVSGYSKVAISEASGSKTTLITIDASHLYLFFSGVMNFKEIISRVRRHASQTGQAYLPANEFCS